MKNIDLIPDNINEFMVYLSTMGMVQSNVNYNELWLDFVKRDGIKVSVCSICGRVLPLNLKYFSTQKIVKSGLRSYCKRCGVQRTTDARLKEKYGDTLFSVKSLEKYENRKIRKEISETNKVIRKINKLIINKNK